VTRKKALHRRTGRIGLRIEVYAKAPAATGQQLDVREPIGIAVGSERHGLAGLLVRREAAVIVEAAEGFSDADVLAAVQIPRQQVDAARPPM
jgi:hypothetical protein